MAADCSKYQIGVNVYAFSDKYTDIASLVFRQQFKGRNWGMLARDLSRETAWEAVMRLRCGTGVKFCSYHDNFILRSTDLLALPAVDCDKALAMQLCLDDTLLTTQTVDFQVALLYAASCGESRIRVHSAAAPVVADLGDMYRQAYIGAIISVLGRLAMEKTLSSKLDDARSYLQMWIFKSLKEYRNVYAVQHRLTDVLLDEQCAVGLTMMTLTVKSLLKFLYPSLIRIDEFLLKPPSDFKDVEQRLPLSQERLDSRGLYVFCDGFRFVIWIGRMVSPDIATTLNIAFDPSEVKLFESKNDMSRNLMRLLDKQRERDPAYFQLCHFVRQGEQPREGYYLLANLFEDQTGGISSYVDWIMQIHRQVQQKA